MVFSQETVLAPLSFFFSFLFLDLPQTFRQWCDDATAANIDEDGFKAHPPGSFAALAASFTEYQS